MKTRVYILHANGHRFRGSVIMRCLQLADIGDGFLGADFDFRVVSMPKKGTGEHLTTCRTMRDAVIILSKAMIQHIDADALALLKRQNIAILADWIDTPLRTPHLDLIDVHLAASRASKRYLEAQMPGACVVNLTHHADPRLGQQRYAPLDQFSSVYLGHPENVPDFDELHDAITFLTATTGAEFQEVLTQLPEHNFHYNVRGDRQPAGVFKPFTKGFTAAACRSNILVPRDVDDAVDFLGDDYPYLIADREVGTVCTALEFARESFGGPEWARGLEVMQDVARRSSPGHIAGELRGILCMVLGRVTAPIMVAA
jgi:hypothetical protein